MSVNKIVVAGFGLRVELTPERLAKESTLPFRKHVWESFNITRTVSEMCFTKIILKLTRSRINSLHYNLNGAVTLSTLLYLKQTNGLCLLKALLLNYVMKLNGLI